MSKFTIEKKIFIEGEHKHLLNRPFRELMDDVDFHATFGRISTYHDPLEFKAEWPRYSILPKCSILIASPLQKTFTVEEAFTFMGMHNGICLTRDNLFMLWRLFPKHLESFKKITAIASAELLPDHLSYKEGTKICPRMEIDEKDAFTKKIDYDWWFLDMEDKPHEGAIAFIQPILYTD